MCISISRVEYDSKSTENALAAVEAYKTIINNIDEAQTKANTAVVESTLLEVSVFSIMVKAPKL